MFFLKISYFIFPHPQTGIFLSRGGGRGIGETPSVPDLLHGNINLLTSIDGPVSNQFERYNCSSRVYLTFGPLQKRHFWTQKAKVERPFVHYTVYLIRFNILITIIKI
jgi:hypothetical protein